ncbi:hypothetical protein SDC9_177523 [bioreactor metagenome]|uniref:Uncharacterized protein n=1 Tax=bioreactor metagenome TaxID=1076179 RepID=A0A645GUY7_9ZZZZ
MQRPIKGDRAAEAQLEAHVDEGLRLLLAAVEGMRDAARHRHVTQMLEQPVGRAPHMKNYGQIKAPRQLQLGAVELLLPRGIQPRHEEVKADLPNRHQALITARIRQRLLQRGEVVLRSARRVQRVNAQGVAVAPAVRHFLAGLPVAALHGRNHAMADPGGARIGAHRVGMRLPAMMDKFVQMTVRVDPERRGRNGQHARDDAAEFCVPPARQPRPRRWFAV